MTGKKKHDDSDLDALEQQAGELRGAVTAAPDAPEGMRGHEGIDWKCAILDILDGILAHLRKHQ